jgi:hypothetical protein
VSRGQCSVFSHFKIKRHLRAADSRFGKHLTHCTSFFEEHTFQITRNVLHKIMWLRVWSFGIRSFVTWLIGTNVLEEPAATILSTDLDPLSSVQIWTLLRRQLVSQKHYYVVAHLHDVRSQKTAYFIFNVIRIKNIFCS